MKKTLKILMAIILFAVVLTIATSVNAVAADGTQANPYATLEAAVTAEKNEATPKVEKSTSGNVYTVKNNLYVEDLGVTSGSVVVIEDTKTLNVVNETRLANTITLAGEGTFAGTVVVNQNGVLYTNLSLTTPKVYGKVYVAEGATVTPDTTPATESLKLDKAVEAQPVVSGAKTKYDTLLVDKNTVKGADSKITITYAITVPGTDAKVTNFEADKEYEVTIEAKYDGIVLNPDQITVAAYAGSDKEANVNTVSITDGKGTFKTDKGLAEGTELALTVTVKGEEKYITAKIGKVEEEPNQPENPDQPNKPEEPIKPDDTNKGDLDDAAAVATGDHIIPATALLAVVVVANVVYFAKSKNN